MSKFETKCLRAGYMPKNGEANVLPIYQSTTFKYESADYMGDLFDFNAEGHFYTRLSNPTNEAVEKKLAELEGGVGAIVTSSGQSALFTAIATICQKGDHIISSTAIYGGTVNLLSVSLKKLGVEVSFVNPEIAEDELEGMVKENTKLIYGETVSNPALKVLDIEKFVRVAHKNKIPFIIDNTFPTPYLCRPIEYGCDIVVHSTSKYLDGHAVSLGGAVVDSGNFDWTASGKFPCMTEPDESYHGLIYTEKFGKSAYIAKARAQVMRDFGMQMSPQNAFLLNMNMETLPIRMERHIENARKVAEFLNNHKKVSWVNYPDLEDNENYLLAKKYLPKGTSGVISFGVNNSREDSVKFMMNLKMITLAVHVADIRTCALHPASTTHRQLNDKQLIECGVTPDLVRLSVGLENVDDIIEDIQNALDKI